MVVRSLVTGRDGNEAATEAAIPEDLIKILAAAHDVTWTTIQGLSEIIRTTKGAKAGDPLADAYFLLLLGKILAQLDVALHMAGYEFVVPYNSQAAILSKEKLMHTDSTELVSIQHIGYIDDLALPVAAKDASKMVEQLASTASILAHVFQTNGLDLNWKPGKTEAVLSIRGAKAQQVKAHLAQQEVPSIPVEGPSGVVQLRVVNQYCHLGTMYNRGRTHGPEVRRRRNAAKPMLVALGPLLRSSYLSVVKKQDLVSSAYLCSLLYNSEVWDALKQRELAALAAEYNAAMKLAYGRTYGKIGRGISEAELLSHGVLPVHYQVRKRRLLFAARVLQGPTSLKALLQATSYSTKTWPHLIRLDLAWLRESKLGDFDKLTDPHVQIEPWIRAMQDGTWKSRIIKVFTNLTDGISGFSLEDFLRGHSMAADIRIAVKCCGKEFFTKHAITLHNVTRHGYRDPARFYAFEDSTCKACMRCFSTRRRLLDHYARTSCLGHIITSGIAPLTAEQVAAADEAERTHTASLRSRGLCASYAERHYFTLEGPSQCSQRLARQEDA
eukprot:TRINITY_DN36845_c1_g1_i1.p1 TRINITY_DN36845_c1_g1~~TRINITY_DN36845_c1_g1_i1.p1  ORF type:complete len:578 (+),score=78.72 TRINITY_DN36845_c1_g1_i1:70-1734(+)